VHAIPVATPFHRPGWIYEEKVDGYRMVAYKRGGVRHPGQLHLPGGDRHPAAAPVARHPRLRRRHDRDDPDAPPRPPGGDGSVVMFVASDLASYVTGTAVVADGGLTAQTGLPSRIPLR
jgi:NAD(P)-dependent dehydrogenase (short-subunit alcohol dehydrogenase family)